MLEKEFSEILNSPLGGEMKPLFYIPHIWTQPPNTQPYMIYWSNTSKYGCLHPLPTPEDLKKFYGEAYYTHLTYADSSVKPTQNGGHFLDKLILRLAWILDRSEKVDLALLEKLAQSKGSLKICDIGCGGGDLLEKFQKAGHQVIGVEPDEKARVAAQSRGIQVLPGSGEALPTELETGSFDLVMMIQSLEHVIDPINTVKNAVGLLRKGGILLLETPNHESLGFRMSGPAWWHTDAGRHIHFFTHNSLKQLQLMAGCEPFLCQYSEYCRQFSQSWISEEQKVWDAIYGNPSDQLATKTSVSRPSRLRAWRLLFSTFARSKRFGYDTVAVYGRK